ncbi:hypothetical protein LY76DRAFT_585632, partial [Colletotrichum caudatum]
MMRAASDVRDSDGEREGEAPSDITVSSQISQCIAVGMERDRCVSSPSRAAFSCTARLLLEM